MTINFVYNGDATRIPTVNSRIEIPGETYGFTSPVVFIVDSYGQNTTDKHPMYKTGELCSINLHGHILIPTGTSIEELFRFLGADPGCNCENDFTDGTGICQECGLKRN